MIWVKAMTKSKFNFLSIALILLAAALGMFVPGFFLKQSSESISGQLQTAPVAGGRGYGNASTQLASSQLTEYEKIKMISNNSNSVEKVVNSNMYIASNYDMVLLAKEKLEMLYLYNLYPVSFKDQNTNWYSYDVTCYEATDSRFEIFSSYCWLITLTKYDKSETHKVLITENGTILYAQALINGLASEPALLSSKYANLDIIGGKVSSYAAIDDPSSLELPAYAPVEAKFTDPQIGIIVVGCPWMNTEKAVLEHSTEYPEYEYYYAVRDCQSTKSMLQYSFEIIPYQ